MVMRAAVHIIGLKLRAVLRKDQVAPLVAFQARTMRSRLQGFSKIISRPSITRSLALRDLRAGAGRGEEAAQAGGRRRGCARRASPAD